MLKSSGHFPLHLTAEWSELLQISLFDSGSADIETVS